MAEKTSKYEVSIIETIGTADTNIFKKMATKGDISPTKITDLLGVEVTITGLAKCRIVTDDKDFEIGYFITDEYGNISSGSEIFYNSVKSYIDDLNTFIIKEIKTNKGKTYKAVPLIKTETTVDKTITNN